MLAGNGPSLARLCASARSSDKADILMLAARGGGHLTKQQRCEQLLRTKQIFIKEIQISVPHRV